MRLAIDTETTGLSWKARPYMLSVYDGRNSGCYDLRNTHDYNSVRHLLTVVDEVVGANTWFDLRMLCCIGLLSLDDVQRLCVRDVLRDNYAVTGAWEGLKPIAHRVLGISPDARDRQFEAMRERHKRCNKVYALTHGYEVWDVTAEYCMEDSRMAWMLAEALPESDTTPDKLTLMQTLKGIRIDRDMAHRIVRELRKVGNDLTVEGGGVIHSPLQLAKKLGTRKADKETLKKSKDPLAKTALEFRSTSKLADMFDSITSEADENGIVHPLLRWSCSTGRAACSDPNLQNLHSSAVRDVVLREVILADCQTDTVISADFSGIELVLFAYICDCQRLINWLKDGRDTHSMLTEMVFGGANALESVCASLPDTYNRRELAINALRESGGSVVGAEKMLTGKSRSRNINKRLMFATIYGAQAAKVSTIVDIPLATGRTLLRRLHGTLPELRHAQEFFASYARQKGFVENACGRRVKCERPHAALNYVIQSSAADIMRRALVRVDDALTTRKIGRTMFTVHDEVVSSVRKGSDHENGKLICQTMTDAASELVDFTIKADYTIHGNRWGLK